MPDEKKDHSLDADILQGKADILKALRAAGKLVPEDAETLPAPASIDADVEILIDSDIAISSQDTDKMDPVSTTGIDETQADEQLYHIQQEHRQLKERFSILQEENSRLKSDLQDQIHSGNQTQRLRSELSETEVALSRERSNVRMLETQLSETENLKITFEQERDLLSEKIQNIEQKKQEIEENFKRLHAEFSDYQEQSGRDIVGLIALGNHY